MVTHDQRQAEKTERIVRLFDGRQVQLSAMLRNYLNLAFKVLLRRKFFTVVSLFGIALHAGGARSRRGDPRPRLRRRTRRRSAPDRTLGVYLRAMTRAPRHRVDQAGPGYLLLDRYARDLPGVERMSVFSTLQVVNAVSYQDGERSPLYLKRTDGDFWQILGFRVPRGRALHRRGRRGGDRGGRRSTRRPAGASSATRPAVGRTVEIDGSPSAWWASCEDVPVPPPDPLRRRLGAVTTGTDRRLPRELRGRLHGRLPRAQPRRLPGDPRGVPLAPGAGRPRGDRRSDGLRRGRDAPRQFARLLLRMGRAARGRPRPVRAAPCGSSWCSPASPSLFMLLPAVNLVNLT